MTRQQIGTGLAALSLIVAVGGCQKESTSSNQETGNAKSIDKRQGESASMGGKAATGSRGGSVTAPMASDLAKFTEGLEGEGTLMTRITTNLGVIHCELYEKDAPLTVASFVGLARGLHPFKNPKTGAVESRPFFDGLIFHRVMPRFMIQGGDPLGRGNGGPGYKFAKEVSDKLKHDRPGILSMANSGPNTNGSQFFITEVPKKGLDGDYNVFGECMEVDVVGKIARVPTQGRPKTTPVTKVVMEKVEIFRDDIKKYPKKNFVK